MSNPLENDAADECAGIRSAASPAMDEILTGIKNQPRLIPYALLGPAWYDGMLKSAIEDDCLTLQKLLDDCRYEIERERVRRFYAQWKYEDPGRKRSRLELAGAAHHAAGHAAALRAFGYEVDSVTIAPVLRGQGWCWGDVASREWSDIFRRGVAAKRIPSKKLIAHVHNWVVAAKVGCLARLHINPAYRERLRDQPELGDAENEAYFNDRWRKQRNGLWSYYDSEAVGDLTGWLTGLGCYLGGMPEAEKLTTDNWPLIEKLARALLRRWTLSGEEIEALLS
jgi:hypothetical protein